MKLPWYVREIKDAPKTDDEGHLIVTFEFSKIWVYWNVFKFLFSKDIIKIKSWQ